MSSVKNERRLHWTNWRENLTEECHNRDETKSLWVVRGLRRHFWSLYLFFTFISSSITPMFILLILLISPQNTQKHSFHPSFFLYLLPLPKFCCSELWWTEDMHMKWLGLSLSYPLPRSNPCEWYHRVYCSTAGIQGWPDKLDKSCNLGICLQ